MTRILRDRFRCVQPPLTWQTLVLLRLTSQPLARPLAHTRDRPAFARVHWSPTVHRAQFVAPSPSGKKPFTRLPHLNPRIRSAPHRRRAQEQRDGNRSLRDVCRRSDGDLPAVRSEFLVARSTAARCPSVAASPFGHAASPVTLRCPAPLRTSRDIHAPAFVACDSPLDARSRLSCLETVRKGISDTRTPHSRTGKTVRGDVSSTRAQAGELRHGPQ